MVKLAILEPIGIRFLGVEIRERQIVAAARTIKEAIYEMNWSMEKADNEFEKLSEMILGFAESVIKDEERAFSINAESLKELFEISGLAEYGKFFRAVLRGISKRKLLVQMVSDFGPVSIEPGSMLVRFRSVKRRTEELKVSLRKIWAEAKMKSKNIRNSFRQFAHWAMTGARRTSLHIGIYGVALIIVFLSIWYSFAFEVAANLGSLASNIISGLKATFPIITFVVFIFCTLFDIVTGKEILEKGFEAAKQFLT